MVLKGDLQVVALAGGVGGAKLVYGLAKTLPPDRLTIIGNVGDDLTLYGLHISPDLDTVMYTLADVANPATGWGVAGDTQHMGDMLRRYGEMPWFMLGDKDLATHLLRSQWLAEGHTLTEVTRRLSQGLGVSQRLLPVTADPVSTMVDTVELGILAFQEYFVRHRWQPVVRRIWYAGIETAHISRAVAQAVEEADIIVFCPSNPMLSIEPILAVPGMRERLRARKGKCVAVSPFIGGQAVKGPAAKLMREQGIEPTPAYLAEYYGGLLDGLVIDQADRELAGQVTNLPVLVTQTLMMSSEDKVRLAGEVLDWVGRL